MIQSPLVSSAQEVVLGGILGVLAALAGQYVLRGLRLRWTWALFPFLAGAVVVWAGVVESWSVALAVGGLVTARWAYQLERRSKEAGGDARRATQRIVGPTDVLAKRRAQRALDAGRLVEGDRFLLGHGPKRRPVSVGFGGKSGRHGLMLGASGSGKTNALLWCLARHVEAGFGAVVVDMKGDQLLARRIQNLARTADVDLYLWTLEGPDHWNPLAHGSRSELKDKLIASEEFTERHYQAMYERYLLNLFRALEDKPQERTLATVVRLLDPNELAMLIRDLDDDQVAEQISVYLQRLTPDQLKDLRGLADRLALLVEGDHGDLLAPNPEGDGIDLLDTIGRGAVVVFSLNSSSQPATAKLLANMVIQDLKTVCGAIERLGQPARAVVAIDEFSSLDGDHIAGLFQRARSAGLSLMVATQELADLRRVDDGFDEQIIGNVEWVLAGRQNNPDSAETVASLAGTEEVWVHTFQTDDIALRGKGPFARESGMGTKHRGREFIVSPDQIKALPVGRMLLVEKNPHRAELVDVFPAHNDPTTTQEAA